MDIYNSKGREEEEGFKSVGVVDWRREKVKQTEQARLYRIVSYQTMIEDWCFVCKDGGDLILCDNGNCSKVYHLECVGYDASENIQQNWTCDCHRCSSCKGAAQVHCFCCPTSFCRDCIKFVKFAPLRPNKGLCPECWTLARLAEKLSFSKKYVDFEDRDTHECLFKEYWDIVKEEQGLNRGDLVGGAGQALVPSDAKTKTKTKIMTTTTDDDDYDTNSSTWGASKPLVHFLTSIGLDTTKQQHLSQHNVTSIILKYAQDRDLIHPSKKMRLICDTNLHLIFKKNTVSMKQIHLLLAPHFSSSNNDKKRCSSESDQRQNPSSSPHGDATTNNKYKHQKKTTTTTTLSTCASQDKESQKKKPYFASLVPHNINLVYLRRSLVEDLLKHPQSFEDKVVGSFVKVILNTNSTPFHSKGGNISQQLWQITAVKKMPTTDDTNISLHVWSLPDIQISMLSDSDITEEDCQNLREKMAKGLFQRLTVEEIEKKARILHQDIRKNWIAKELVNLQNLIDRANEKGRRKETLNQLLDQRQTLKKEAEQLPLVLKQLPTVIVDSPEDEADDARAKANPSSLQFTLVN